jgi:hypothetical protein
MQKDLMSVNQGHSPMADAEVLDAIRASAGLSPIKDPQKSTSGPLDILGNIPSDIGSIVTGFIPGTVKYAASLPTQLGDLWTYYTGTEQQQAKIAQQYGMKQGSDIQDIGDLLTGISHFPVFGPLIPGVHTAALATTSTGRKELEQHPVGTLLDVGAALAEGGKLAGIGMEAGAAGAGEEAAAKAPTVREALAAGKPYKAAGRALLKGIEATPKVGERINRSTIRQFLEDHAIHPDQVANISKPAAQIDDANSLRMQKFVKEEILPKYQSLTEEEANLVDTVAHTGDWSPIADRPDLQTVAYGLKVLQDEAGRANPALREIEAEWGRSYFYQRSHPVAQSFEAVRSAEKQVAELKPKLDKAEQLYLSRKAKYGENRRTTQVARAKYEDLQAKWEKADKAHDKAQSAFHENFSKYAPAAFYSHLDPAAREMASNAAEQQYRDALVKGTNEATAQAKLTSALNQIMGAQNWGDFIRAVGNQETTRIRAEVEATWQTVAKQGIDPIYIPNTSATKLEQVMNPSIIPDARYASSYSSKDTMFNLGRSQANVFVGVTATQRDMLREAGQHEFVNDYLINQGNVKIENDITDSITNAIRNGGGKDAATWADVRAQARAETSRHWVKFSPDDYGMAEYFPSAEGGEWMIPRGVERTLKYMGFSKEKKYGPLNATYDYGMKIWRFSVLTTPRHISHITLGGAMMGTLQDPLFGAHFIRNFKAAHDMITGDDYSLIAKLGGKNTHEFTDAQIYHAAAAKSWGRIMSTVLHPLDKLKNFEENVTLMYKATEMIAKEKKGLGREEALQVVNKIFVDRNAMTPFERATIARLFPFYGFTRHIFRYLMTYPADHPLAAAILTNFALQEQADRKSGLPNNLGFMFFLGQPDAQGNVTGIDYRSIDPFRSFFNDFTWAGFWSQVNPALQFVAQQSGVNILSGTPELYPQVHYDPQSGTLVADRPSPQNALMGALETMIPEAQGADAYLQLSDQWKNLKTTDPMAFKQRLYTALGMPFYPESFNLPLKQEVTQMKRYRDAQSSINAAVQTGDFSKAKRYSYVPIPSLLRRYFGNMTYATPQQIEQIFKALQGRYPSGTNIHAVLPKPSQRHR